jgi:hypothetical protein
MLLPCIGVIKRICSQATSFWGAFFSLFQWQRYLLRRNMTHISIWLVAQKHVTSSELRKQMDRGAKSGTGYLLVFVNNWGMMRIAAFSYVSGFFLSSSCRPNPHRNSPLCIDWTEKKSAYKTYWMSMYESSWDEPGRMKGGYTKGLPSDVFSLGCPVKILNVVHARYIPYQSHPSWLEHPSNIWRRLQITEFIKVQLSPASYRFITLRPQYSGLADAHCVELHTFCLPYIGLSKTSNHCIFTLKMTAIMFAEMLVIFQHFTQFHLGRRSCTHNSSRENLNTRTCLIVKNCFHVSLRNPHIKSVSDERFRFYWDLHFNL